MFKYYLFKDVTPEVLKIIHKEGKILGTFLFNSKVKIKKCKLMEKLINRTAGGFMTPLKNCRE